MYKIDAVHVHTSTLYPCDFDSNLKRSVAIIVFPLPATFCCCCRFSILVSNKSIVVYCFRHFTVFFARTFCLLVLFFMFFFLVAENIYKIVCFVHYFCYVLFAFGFWALASVRNDRIASKQQNSHSRKNIEYNVLLFQIIYSISWLNAHYSVQRFGHVLKRLFTDINIQYNWVYMYYRAYNSGKHIFCIHVHQ